jgi:glycosyltransferase involved in cell wall biosynthesis
MSLGKVIITTTIGSEGIDTNHNENILIADTEMDFIKSIEQLVTDQNLFNKISNNAIKFIENNFNNNNITAELVDFYKFQINNLV